MMAISFSKSSLFILPPDVGAVYRNARLKSTLYANRAYDFASSRKFIPGAAGPLSLLYLHGRSDGFLLLNTEEEINSLMGNLSSVFEDSNRNRTWIIVGYSGNDKPVFEGIAGLDSYQYGLYWVGYKNQHPSALVEQEILRRKDTYFVTGETSDTFFEKLSASLRLRLDEYSRPKVRMNLEEVDGKLTYAGLAEAADLFDVTTDMITCLVYKIYHERTGLSYLHRIFIKKSDFELIRDEFNKNENINIIKTLIRSTMLNLHLYKSHQFIPTVVGGDEIAIGQNRTCPAILHTPVSYIEHNHSCPSTGGVENNTLLKPIELLLSKYTTQLNSCGFLLDRTP